MKTKLEKQVRVRVPLRSPVDWPVSCKLNGKMGQILSVQLETNCLFRGENLLATDTSNRPGFGTRVRRILVGQEEQIPTNYPGILTIFFSGNMIMKWKTCEKLLTIKIEVEFLEDCSFEATCLGKAIL